MAEQPVRSKKDKNDASRRKSLKSGDSNVVRFRTSFKNTIYDVMKSRGWKENETDWDFHWADRCWMSDGFDEAALESHQRVCHFRNDKELCRKDLLIKNVKRFKKFLEKEKRTEEAEEFDFCPNTFVLPAEYSIFVEAFKQSNSAATWIMKPIGRSQGKGIFLFRNLNQINKWRSEFRWKPENSEVESYVVQKYISNPFLIGGKKFDMRIYALVTSFSPLTIYFYRGGFARFSNSRYSSNPSDISKAHVHLTNVAVQKGAENYDKDTGSKWDIRSLKLYLISRFGIEKADECFVGIENIVVKSLQSVQAVMINDKHCFELYGYDIMLDDDMKPWLIEVNASPSLSANTTEDYNLKYSMLSDLLDIVDLEKRFTGDEERMGGFDMIYKGKRCKRKKSTIGTYLGCEIPIHEPYRSEN